MEYDTGTISRLKGSFGFILCNDGSEMFVLPNSCAMFGRVIPPLGTPVRFTVTTDVKTGKLRADSVEPVDGLGASDSFQHAQDPTQWPLDDQELEQLLSTPKDPLGRQSTRQQQSVDAFSYEAEKQAGTVAKHNGTGKFGFIKQDADGSEMFLLPGACHMFNNELPAIGTRVMYDVVTDSKTGKPRAENVEPEGGLSQFHAHVAPVPQVSHAPMQPPMPHLAMQMQMPATGGIDLFSGSQSRGAVAFRGAPSKGPRVPGMHPPGTFGGKGAGTVSAADTLAGTLKRNKGNFGFIEQDNGDAEMFVMPAACDAFGNEIPPLGTRVTYEVVADIKTGRPRAENVQPEGAPGKGTSGYGAVKGGGIAVKGGGKARVSPW